MPPFVPPPGERALAQAKKKPIGVMLPPPKPRQSKTAAAPSTASAAALPVAAPASGASAAAPSSNSSPAKLSPSPEPPLLLSPSSSPLSPSSNADFTRYTLGIDDVTGEPDSDDSSAAASVAAPHGAEFTSPIAANPSRTRCG